MKKNYATSEQHLWEGIRKGQMEALQTVYNCHFESLYSYGLKIAKDKLLVEDAIHDLFCDLWDRQERLGTTDNIKFYLFVMLKRKLLRAKPERAEILDQEIEKSFGMEAGQQIEGTLFYTHNIDKASQKQLAKAMQHLTKKQREVVFLKFYGKLKYEEIADMLGVNYQSVVNNVFRAMQQLRQELQVSFAA